MNSQSHRQSSSLPSASLTDARHHHKIGFLHMPKIFYVVLLVEFWERFAFYGVQAVAVVYFIQGFGMSDAQSSDLFGSFVALLYALLTVGGAIGDKLLGIRRTYLLGIVFLIIGYAMLSVAHDVNHIYFAMGIVLTGNIFFKTNANNYVARCFEANDPRLDSAFTYFYMSINLGSTFSMLLVPILTKALNPHIGLSLCSFGMIVALVSYIGFRKHFVLADNQIGRQKGILMNVRLLLVAVFGVLCAYLLGFLLHDLTFSRIILYSIAVLVVIYYIFLASRLNRSESRGMFLALIFLTQAFFFFIFYIQSANSMTIFALHNVRLHVFGYDVHPGMTQVFNPIAIIVLSPMLANLYMLFSRRRIDFDIPVKFILGILIVGLCFITLGVAASFFTDSDAKVSMWWLVLAYALFSLGELLISALGPSMVAKLIPKRYGGFAQGMWYLLVAIGISVGTQLASLTASTTTHITDNVLILNAYKGLFYKLGFGAFVVVIMYLFMLKKVNAAYRRIVENRY